MALENSWDRANSADSLLKIKALYPTDYLGFCYDSGHANIIDNGRLYPNGVAWERWQALGIAEPVWEDQTLEKMLPYVVNCHLHDNDGSRDAHDLPGRGNVNWAKTVSLLRQAPRLQVIQCEVNYLINTIAIREMVETFDKLFIDN